jgi:hypothetical protein
MPVAIVVHQEIHIGTPTVVEAPAPDRRFKVVFEDDGSTGYFYALDSSSAGQPIQDALHIYDAKRLIGHKHPTVEIAWSSDGLKAELLLDKEPQAVFDFSAKRGYCRTGFPPSHGAWLIAGHSWSSQAPALIK